MAEMVLAPAGTQQLRVELLEAYRVLVPLETFKLRVRLVAPGFDSAAPVVSVEMVEDRYSEEVDRVELPQASDSLLTQTAVLVVLVPSIPVLLQQKPEARAVLESSSLRFSVKD
jgi:hypothetical protein